MVLTVEIITETTASAALEADLLDRQSHPTNTRTIPAMPTVPRTPTSLWAPLLTWPLMLMNRAITTARIPNHTLRAPYRPQALIQVNARYGEDVL